MIDGGGETFLGEETRAAEHSVVGEGGLEFGGLPSPVEHIGAGDMDEGEGFPAFPRVGDDVVHVVDAIEAKGGIGVAWSAGGTGVHEVEIEGEVVGRFWGSGWIFGGQEWGKEEGGEEDQPREGGGGGSGGVVHEWGVIRDLGRAWQSCCEACPRFWGGEG